MKTYCLVCKKLTDNNNSPTVKNKGICSVCGNKKVDLFHKDLVCSIV